MNVLLVGTWCGRQIDEVATLDDDREDSRHRFKIFTTSCVQLLLTQWRHSAVVAPTWYSELVHAALLFRMPRCDLVSGTKFRPLYTVGFC